MLGRICTCGTIVYNGYSQCSRCRNSKRSPSSRRTGTRAWRQLRRAVFAA